MEQKNLVTSAIQNWVDNKVEPNLEEKRLFELLFNYSFNEFKIRTNPSYIKKAFKKETSLNLFSNEESKSLKPALEIRFSNFDFSTLESVDYSIQKSIFGAILIATISEKICWLAFAHDIPKSIQELKVYFNKINLNEENNDFHKEIISSLFNPSKRQLKSLELSISGSSFQIRVWQTLAKIPFGELNTYGDIAKKLNMPLSASRAIGTAVGKNCIAFVIPCHRIVRNSGVIGDFRWGKPTKMTLLGWEASL